MGEYWHEVEVDDLDAMSDWTWQANHGDEMVGTYRGRAEGLYQMAADAARGEAYFPAEPIIKFKPGTTLTQYDSPIFGVGLVDLDGDGRLDVYACNPEEGDRALLQNADGTFTDATNALGLDGTRSRSVSAADFDADGRIDLLAGRRLLLNREDGFTALSGPELPGELIAAAFVEVNGDGYPDVVYSVRDHGLIIAINRGGEDLDLRAPETFGLDSPDAGAGQSFLFTPGDWNGDNRTDLFCAFGGGVLLTQDDDGRFTPVEADLHASFRTANATPVPFTGAGSFVPILDDGEMDLAVAADAAIHVFANEDGRPVDITGSGNESRLAHSDQRATLGEDLNVDGTVDLFTISNAPRGEHVFHCNRGYGQFMLSEQYVDYDAFPGEAFAVGAGGVAAGDVNGDGAPDLLLGGVDGGLRLVLNDSLEARKHFDRPRHNERKQAQTRIVAIDVVGPRGVTGATARIVDADGRTVALRQIGTAVLTGCAGPQRLWLAVREPGRYSLTVRYADGALAEREIDLSDPHAERTVHVRVDRPEPESGPEERSSER